MKNKKSIAKGLACATLLSNVSISSLAYTVEGYEVLEKNNYKKMFKGISLQKTNKKIVKNSIFEITLGDGDSIPDLTGNPNGYETIVVTTTGEKVLSGDDFTNLNLSTIPNIDLSNAKANSIPRDAFTSNTSLVSFKFPQGITSIGSSAFKGCSNLIEELVFPSSLVSIGDSAFESCTRLTGNLIIPDLVTSIGSSAFRACSGLNGVLKLSDKITNLGGSAFYGCTKLSGNLTIPSSLKKISSNTFRDCHSFTGDLIVPDTVTVVDVNAFYNCRGFNGKLVISKNLKTIAANSFLGCSGLKGDINIPDGVTSIAASAFYGSSGFDGDLIMPDSITSIGANAFYNCSKLTGELKLPKSLKTVGRTVFGGTRFTGDVYVPNTLNTVDTNMFPSTINRVIVKIGEEDEGTNYRKNVISSFEKSKVCIEVSSSLDVSNTWIKEENYNVIKPIVKSIIDGVEIDVVDENNETVILEIPTLFVKDKSYILKDGQPYNFPSKNSNGRYIFTDEGDYELVIETELGALYNTQFGVRTKAMQEAESLVTEIIDTPPTVNNLNEIRRKVNALPESFRKEELQRILNSISVDLELERKTISSNVDIYIKCENMLSMSLDTNQVTFENFNGTEDMVKENAIEISINSSLPYQLNAYLPTEIQNSDKSQSMNLDILNIKESSESVYQGFENTTDKIVLKDNCLAGNNLLHSIDLKLVGGIAHEKDVYKTTIKFEVEQK